MKLSLIVQEYLAYKKALGAVFRVDTYRLQAFLRHIGDVDLEAIRTDQVQEFLQGKFGIVTPVWFGKFSALSCCFKYSISRGYLQHEPLPTSIPRKPEEMCPFLYTVAQIKNLLDVPDTAYHPRAHIEPHTMRAFLVLLYGTGLRPGEAMLGLAPIIFRLNQVERWFSILTKQALTGVSFTSPQQLRGAIDKFVTAYNKTATPFEWTKASFIRPPPSGSTLICAK